MMPEAHAASIIPAKPVFWPLFIALLALAASAPAQTVTSAALAVVIKPAQAAADGAQWRRTGTTTWLNSGTTETAVAAGVHWIECKMLTGWTTPELTSVTLVDGSTTRTTLTYNPPQADIKWSSYMGGSGGDEIALGVAIDKGQNVYIAGTTYSPGWVWGGLDSDYGIQGDAFVVKLNANGQHVWSSFLGGYYFDTARSITVDNTNRVYVAGETASEGWIAGYHDSSYNGGTDGFLVKLSATGAHLWSTYLGSTNADVAYGVATDRAGNVFVVGETLSPSGWIANGYDTTFNSSPWSYSDAFAVKLTSGGVHTWSTYLGGINAEAALAAATDSAGNLCVAGRTTSPSWLSGGPDNTWGGIGHDDGFVLKIAADGSSALWGTYLGGTGTEYANGIDVDAQDNIVAVGQTDSAASWAAGGFDTSYNGGTDGFAIKLTPAGQHVWSTYLGGSGADQANGVAVVDNSGEIFVAGSTASLSWVWGGFQQTRRGASDGFVLRLDAAGRHLWSTCLGGNGVETANAITTGTGRTVHVAGSTQSSDWVSGGYDISRASTTDAYVSKVRDVAHIHKRGNLAGVITPPEAVAAGAQWRRVGTTLWNNSNTTEINIALGTHAVEFRPVTFYDTPSTVSVEIVDEQTTVVTGNYVRGIGSLCVTIQPALAVTDGAKWKRVGEATWRDSGTTETGILSGSYQVEFLVPWRWSQAYLDVTVNSHQTTQLTATYNRLSGPIVGVLYPNLAVNQGAQWRRTGTTTWFNSGQSETVPMDDYTIEFKDTADWAPPAPQTIRNEKPFVPNYVYADYTRKTGQLKIQVEPPAARGSVQWRRHAPPYEWRTDSQGESNIETGVYELDILVSSPWKLYLKPTVRINWNTTTTLPVPCEPSWMTMGQGTYLGAAQDDEALGVEIDPYGNIYVTGSTGSAGWISGGLDTTFGGGASDAFATKLTSALQPVWTTYLGGSAADAGCGISLDNNENVFVTGSTSSAGWLSGGEDDSYNGGASDGFLIKLDAGGHPVWGTYIGGPGEDRATCIAKEDWFYVTVGGTTDAGGWLSTGFGNTYGGQKDGFAAQYWGATGKGNWSRCLGGSGVDEVRGLAVANNGYPVACGITRSSGWISGGFDTTFHGSGNDDGFALKLSPQGQLLWSTYLGGTGNDSAADIVVDTYQNLCICGTTNSPGWIPNTFGEAHHGAADGFVLKLTSAGQLVWSTCLGAAGNESATALDRDDWGNLYVGGHTDSWNWLTGGAGRIGGMKPGQDGFLAMLTYGGRFAWGTYLGQDANDWVNDLATDTMGFLAIAGKTQSSHDWIWSGYDTTFGGGVTDGYVLTMMEDSSLATVARGSVKVTLSPAGAVSAGAKWRRLGTQEWQDSGAQTDVMVGSYWIEFKPAAGWREPARALVSVSSGQTAQITRIYSDPRNGVAGWEKLE